MNRIFIIVFALIVTGCTTKAVQQKATPDLPKLTFIQDNITTKKEVFIKLGPPTGSFDNEKILTYRLFNDPDIGEEWHVTDKCLPFSWRFTNYNLVLVFNESDILTEHSLVRIGK